MRAQYAWILGAAVLLLAACTSVPPSRFDTSEARTELPVAMVSMVSDVDPRVNRDRIGRYIELIAAEQPEVRLICFGEASLGWYWTGTGSARYHRSIAEPLDTVLLLGSAPPQEPLRAVRHAQRVHAG